MSPTDILKREHESIKLMLAVLSRVCGQITAKQKVPLEHLKKILKFIQIFADNLHHGKEETVLFPALEKAGVPREGGPICVMLMEHQMGREYVSGMSGAIEKCEKKGKPVGAEFVSHAKGYISLLNRHIDKEETCLFTMAENLLSLEDKVEINESFKRVDRQKMSEEDQQALYTILDDLKQIYLPDSILPVLQ